MNGARETERRSARSGRNGNGPSGDEARPDYDLYEQGISDHKRWWAGLLAASLARRRGSDLIALATLASLLYIGVQFTGNAQVSPLGLAGALAAALLIAAVGTVMFVVGRRQDAETGEKCPDPTPQSRSKHERSSEARGSARRD